MKKSKEMPLEHFREIIEESIGAQWPRAWDIFQKFGPHFSYDVCGVLEMAIEKGRTDEVIEKLEKKLLEFKIKKYNLRGIDFNTTLSFRVVKTFFEEDIYAQILGFGA